MAFFSHILQNYQFIYIQIETIGLERETSTCLIFLSFFNQIGGL